MSTTWPGNPIARVLIVAFLALQIAVPVVAVFGERPQRFAWHMYSALPPVPQAWVVRADGTEEPMELEALFVVPRAEIDYASVLWDRLCSVPDVVRVRVESEGGADEVIACR